MYLVGFPLLLIAFAIYNIVAFITPGVSWTEPLTRVGFPSGGEWTMSLGDLLVTLAVLLLLVEIVKAHRSGGRYLMDHLLSALLLVAMSAEFYLVPRATSSTFFLLLVASLADVIGGLVALRRRPAIVKPDRSADAEKMLAPVSPLTPAPLTPVSASPVSASPVSPPVQTVTEPQVIPPAPEHVVPTSVPPLAAEPSATPDASISDRPVSATSAPNPDRP
jgi:uncharacterized membrane protein